MSKGTELIHTSHGFVGTGLESQHTIHICIYLFVTQLDELVHLITKPELRSAQLSDRRGAPFVALEP